MKLSIIIPLYNCEKFVKECLDSIFNEATNKDNFEVILINDGSTDRTKDIISNYSIKSSNIKIINQENHGVSYSRNCGIKKATGKYLMFVDGDDVLEKFWYKNIKKYLENSKYDIIYFSKNGEYIKKEKMLSYIIGYNDKNICLAGPYSKIFKREMILKNDIKFYEELINGEDMLFNIRAFLASKSIKIDSGSFYKYRIYSGSATKKFDSNIFYSDIKFYEYLNVILTTQMVEEKTIKNIRDYCLANAVMNISGRVCYISSYKLAKKYFNKLNNNPYLEIKKNGYKLVNNKKIRLILLLYKKNMFFFIYKILSFNILILKHKQKNTFFEIL